MCAEISDQELEALQQEANRRALLTPGVVAGAGLFSSSSREMLDFVLFAFKLRRRKYLPKTCDSH
jgi:hypothetical protein